MESDPNRRSHPRGRPVPNRRQLKTCSGRQLEWRKRRIEPSKGQGQSNSFNRSFSIAFFGLFGSPFSVFLDEVRHEGVDDALFFTSADRCAAGPGAKSFLRKDFRHRRSFTWRIASEEVPQIPVA